MTLTAGTRLGPYEIVAPIGAGGMGEVYRANDTKLGRDVAIKVLPESFAHEAERMARFEREAQVLASLNHPHIATIYGLEESNDIRALVMELVEGPTLAERICHQAMPLDEALPIAKQIAEGLEYAHERGIIHRDLKPANVKLTADGNVKILDFGLAKALETPTPQGNPSISPTLTLEGTRAGVILGTAAYMAPEQARGAIVDKRADIWAFGVVLYEMLTGKQPFAAATVSDTLAAVLKTEPDCDAVPAEVRGLVRRCLDKDAKRRMRDIGEARLSIDEHLSGEASSAEIVPQTALKRSLPWAVAGVLAVALVVALWAPWRSTPHEDKPLTRLDVNLGQDVTLASSVGANVIFSPDGTRLLFVALGSDGIRRLIVRQLDQPKSTELVGTEGAFAPFFSPDGQWVGFFAGGKIKKIALGGGAAIPLCDAPAGRGATWGEDGYITAALNFQGGLYRIPSAGGTPKVFTELNKGEATHRWPQVLPGGRGVLFTAATLLMDYQGANIEVQPLPNGPRKVLHRGGTFGRYLPSGHLAYFSKDTLFVEPFDLRRLESRGASTPALTGVTYSFTGYAQFDVSPTGTAAYRSQAAETKRTIQWLDATGTMKPLLAEPAEYGGPRLSPDGKRVAFLIGDGSSKSVWVYHLERDTRIQLTSGIDVQGFLAWSPDGRYLANYSNAGMLWLRADGAGKPLALTQSVNPQYPYSFTPDGKRLAYMQSNPETGWDMWTVSLEGNPDQPKAEEPQVLLQTPANELYPAFSPDGRWLAYSSDESGTSEVYVRSLADTGGKWLVSNGGGIMPVWSRSARELFYRTEDNWIMAAKYSENGNSFAADKPRVWSKKPLVDTVLAPNFDLALDGYRFAVLMGREGASEQKAGSHVVFLLNFFDELRRRAPAGGK